MRTALVTGASRGIGRAIAIELSKQGHLILVNYLKRKDAALEVAHTIMENGGHAELLPFDVTDVKTCKEIISQAIKQHKTIDIVVNNAGINKDMLFPATKFESWDLIIQTTLTGFYAVTRPCIRAMLAKKWGRIINISSAAGQVGNPGQVAYSAAKAGLIGATRSLSAELCHHGILVNAITPGFIDTDLLSQAKISKEDLQNRIPVGRLGEAEEVAKLAVFLASDDASYITGQVIGINGGLF